jgi:hypothetical protein
MSIIKIIQRVPKKPGSRINNYVFIKNKIPLLYHSTFMIQPCFYLYCTQDMKFQSHRNIKFVKPLRIIISTLLWIKISSNAELIYAGSDFFCTPSRNDTIPPVEPSCLIFYPNFVHQRLWGSLHYETKLLYFCLYPSIHKRHNSHISSQIVLPPILYQMVCLNLFLCERKAYRDDPRHTQSLEDPSRFGRVRL